MNSTYPCIRLNNLEISISWYCDFLQFRCTFRSSLKDPEYAVIEKNTQKIYLIKDERREAYASNVLIIEVDDLDSEYEILLNSGVIITQAIDNGLFSGNEFTIKDYEDNKIIYHQNI